MTSQTEPKVIKILLIEDNPDSIQLIQEELIEGNTNKFELKSAERLSAGLKLVEETTFDVILLDMSLPDSQGIETLIKAHTHAPEIPIVVLTNYDDEAFSIKAVQEGAQDYVVKRHIEGYLLSRSIRYAIERQKMLKELEQARLRLHHMAHHDSLTNLPNRNLFSEHLSKSIARANRQNKILAVLFFDLDNFKQVNDTLGHNVGDLLLQSATKRLNKCLRESDIVARMGGDEFTVVLDDINFPHDAAKIAQKILDEMANVFIIDEHEAHVSASIGISLYPNDGNDNETLMKNADVAMYAAKHDGKNNYKFFLPELNERVVENIITKGKLS